MMARNELQASFEKKAMPLELPSSPVTGTPSSDPCHEQERQVPSTDPRCLEDGPSQRFLHWMQVRDLRHSVELDNFHFLWIYVCHDYFACALM